MGIVLEWLQHGSTFWFRLQYGSVPVLIFPSWELHVRQIHLWALGAREAIVWSLGLTPTYLVGVFIVQICPDDFVQPLSNQISPKTISVMQTSVLASSCNCRRLKSRRVQTAPIWLIMRDTTAPVRIEVLMREFPKASPRICNPDKKDFLQEPEGREP